MPRTACFTEALPRVHIARQLADRARQFSRIGHAPRRAAALKLGRDHPEIGRARPELNRTPARRRLDRRLAIGVRPQGLAHKHEVA